MGVLTKLSLKQINELTKIDNIEFSCLKETLNGISDTTYELKTKENKKYIFKLFENLDCKEFEEQVFILKHLRTLEVPKVVLNSRLFYKSKPACIFSFIEGEIAKTIEITHIEQIVSFLLKLHNIKIKPKTKNIYTKEYFLKMLNLVDKSLKEEFEKRYKVLKDIDLKPNGLIHGDLFPDNSKFKAEQLSGVYDFTQSCYGNIYFDLAVVIVSWCFKKFKFDFKLFYKALQTYSVKQKLTKKEIKSYLLFASLYYSLQRAVKNNGDYKEYLIKFDILEKII